MLFAFLNSLFFKRFTDAAETPVDGRPDADFRGRTVEEGKLFMCSGFLIFHYIW
jgi:hypothetical protein